MEHQPLHDWTREERRTRTPVMLALAAVTVFALVLRLHGLDAESLWMDEAGQVSFYGLPLHRAALATADPLDCLIGAALHRMGLAGSDWWVRFPAVLFGTAGVFVFGWFVTRIAGGVVGVTAAALLSICPLHIAMSQEARPYITFFFLALVTVFVLAHARRRNSFLSWGTFGVATFALLLARWFAAQVFTLTLMVYPLGAYLAARRHPDSSRRRLEGQRLLACFGAVAAAYAVYNPLAASVFSRTWAYTRGQREPWVAGFGKVLSRAWHGLFCGNTLPSSFGIPDNRWFLITATILVALGLVIFLKRVWRNRDPISTLFTIALFTFPLLYAAVYAAFIPALSKPQYLLLMAAPLFACLAVTADTFRRLFPPARRIVPWCVFALVVGFVGFPMARASAHAFRAIDKVNWRDAMACLRRHAAPDDAFAVVRPYDSPGSMGAFVIGAGRYFRPGVSFLKIGFKPRLDALERPPWTCDGKTVWLVCNYAWVGGKALPPLGDDDPNRRVHAFAPLFLIELRGEGPPVDRLMEGLALLDRNRPDQEGIVVSNFFRARYFLSRGRHTEAALCLDAARSQCRTDTTRQMLGQRFSDAQGGRTFSLRPSE